MPRIAGVDVPNEKRIDVALQYIHGIGRPTALRLLAAVGVDPAKRAKVLTEEELSKIAAFIDKNVIVEGQLRRQLLQNVTRLRKIGCYRGLRHARGLPVRGQRTHTNARTRKGPRRVTIKKKVVV